MKFVICSTIPNVLPFLKTELGNTRYELAGWLFHVGSRQTESSLGCSVGSLVAGNVYMTRNEMEWTDEKVFELIVLYEQHPCLYDVRSKSNRNRYDKNSAVAEIARHFATSGEHSYCVVTIGGAKLFRRGGQAVISLAATDRVYQAMVGERRTLLYSIYIRKCLYTRLAV